MIIDMFCPPLAHYGGIHFELACLYGTPNDEEPYILQNGVTACTQLGAFNT